MPAKRLAAGAVTRTTFDETQGDLPGGAYGLQPAIRSHNNQPQHEASRKVGQEAIEAPRVAGIDSNEYAIDSKVKSSFHKGIDSKKLVDARRKIPGSKPRNRDR